MKKTRIDFQKKLMLKKELLGNLNTDQMSHFAGGATNSTCQVTMQPALCHGQTNEYGCTTHSLGIACTVIFCA